MIDQTEAEYFAFRAQQCRSAGNASADPVTGYAHLALARRYDDWSRSSAENASRAAAETAGE